MKRVHRKLHFGHHASKGQDVSAFRVALHDQLTHLKLGFLFQPRTVPSTRHTIARCVFALGLGEAAHKAALRGEVGKWTQRKVRNPVLRSPLDRARAARRRPALRAWRIDHRRRRVTLMYDCVDPATIPVDAPAVAGYTGGKWPTYHELGDLFPHAKKVSIAIAAREDADALDCEPGDARPEDAPDWAARQLHRRQSDPDFYNLDKPYIYCSISDVAEVRSRLRSADLLEQVGIWSAHVGQGEHICGPTTCGWPGVDESVGLTQWTWTALGLNLDQSVLGPHVF